MTIQPLRSSGTEERLEHPPTIGSTSSCTECGLPTPLMHGFSTLRLANTPNAVPRARHHTAGVLRRWYVPSHTIETARLVVSELVTNAVRHSPPSMVTLTLRRNAARVLLMLHDVSRCPPPARRAVAHDAERGRGLLLVDYVSVRWGVLFPESEQGKVVWSALALCLCKNRIGDFIQ